MRRVRGHPGYNGRGARHDGSAQHSGPASAQDAAIRIAPQAPGPKDRSIFCSGDCAVGGPAPTTNAMCQQKRLRARDCATPPASHTKHPSKRSVHPTTCCNVLDATYALLTFTSGTHNGGSTRDSERMRPGKMLQRHHGVPRNRPAPQCRSIAQSRLDVRAGRQHPPRARSS